MSAFESTNIELVVCARQIVVISNFCIAYLSNNKTHSLFDLIQCTPYLHFRGIM